MKITEYLTSKGVSPFGRWYKKLDKSLQTKVDEIVLLLIGGGISLANQKTSRRPRTF